jgi:signal peptidase I
MMAAFLVPIPSIWFVAALPPSIGATTAAVALIAALTLALFAIAQAVVGARRAGTVPLAWFNRWYIYTGLIVLATAWQNLIQLAPIPAIRGFSMPSGGSAPTLLAGDFFEARTNAFRNRLPERGELAVLTTAADPEVCFVKRVIGLPGDRVQVHEGRLYLNGALVKRATLSDSDAAPMLKDFPNGHAYREILPTGDSYLILEIGDDEELDNTPEFLVPPDHVFVLGDNRDRSNDSRTRLGFIPIALLHSKPLFIYWSGDLSRIGKVVE